MGGVSATGAGGTAAAVVNSQPSPHRVGEIAVRASRWKSQKAPMMPRPGGSSVNAEGPCPVRFGALLPNRGAMLPARW